MKLFILIGYYLLRCSFAVKNSNKQEHPNLSHLRESSRSEEGIDLSLTLGSFAQSSHQTEQHSKHSQQSKPKRYYDMRTKEYKELKRKNPEIEFRTEKQKKDQIYQKSYKDRIKSKPENERNEQRTKRLQAKRESFQRRIQMLGYGYGMHGEINRLKKKQEQQGSLSIEDSQRLEKLRKDNSNRVVNFRRKRKLKVTYQSADKSPQL